MHRKVHANCLARRSLAQLQLQLRCKPVDKWPLKLFAAWQILQGELRLPDDKALSLVLESVSAAHHYLQAESQQVKKISEFETNQRIQNACRLICKRAKKAPEHLIRCLDHALLPLVLAPVIDLEVIESILEIAALIFQERELQAVHVSALEPTLCCKLNDAIAELAAIDRKFIRKERWRCWRR